MPPTSPDRSDGSADLASLRDESRQRWIHAAFALYLVAWTGFCALRTAAENLEQFNGIGLGIGLLGLAAVATAATLHIGSALQSAAKKLFVILSLVVLGISGVSELLYRILPEPILVPVAVVGQPFPYIAVIVYPFIISAALILTIGASSNGSPPAQAEVVARVLMISIATIAAGISVVAAVAMWRGFTEASLSSWMMPDRGLLVVSGIGTAALPVLLRIQRNAIVRISTCFALVSGLQLCFLSTIGAVYSDATGIGGALLMMAALLVFPTAVTTALLAASILGVRDRARADL